MHARILSDPGRPYGRTVQPKLRPGERCLACGLTAPAEPEPAPSPRRAIADGWRLDPDRRAIVAGGAVINLGSTEFGLMEVLAACPGALCSKATLAAAVWGMPLETDAHAMSVAICRLRQKVKAAGLDPSIIQTIRWKGYRLRPQGEQPC